MRRVNAFLNKLRPMAETKGTSLSQFVIAPTLAQLGTAVAPMGAHTPEPATRNAQAGDVKFSFEEVDCINRQLTDVKL